MEARIALLAAFISSALLGLVSLIFLFVTGPYFLHEVQVRPVCWSVKHSDTVVVKAGIGTFGCLGRCQVLLENEISIFIKLVSRGTHKKNSTHLGILETT
ncbi:hypothetical protein ATANTOWER_006833 [Ataeniobius toweri]|uniref:Uncharacterized protein n=1 Tax=Ataeniobius toweri TaxID=208326 RepID=A0ABU7C5G0_9TELE|nr:hypothetical protein [Ataeniobius toweri]